MPCLLANLELHRVTRLLLSDGRAIDCIAMRGDIFVSQSHDIASTQFDRRIEQRQVALSICDLQVGSDRPDPIGWSGGLEHVNLPLFQGAYQRTAAWRLWRFWRASIRNARNSSRT